MRIVVVEPDGAGGLAHYAHQLCTGLAAAGADVTLITGREHELAGLERVFRVEPILRLWSAVEPPPRNGWVRMGRRLRRIPRAVRYAWEWRRLTRRILELKPDIAQFSQIRFPFQVVFLRRLRKNGIRLAQICHEFEPRERSTPVRRLTRTTLGAVHREFDLIALHGQVNREAFTASFPGLEERTFTIAHGDEAMLAADGDGCDLRSEYGIDEGLPVVLFFGGIRPSKGVEDLIDAFADVLTEVDAHLLVVGLPVGVDPDSLRRRAQGQGIRHRFTLDARYVPLGEVGQVFRTATVVALPYRSATASGVLQAAYANARPVVVTRLGALTEDVIDGTTGLVVPPADRPALARALIKLVADSAEAHLMGCAGQRLAGERFSWAPIAETLLDEYRKLR